MEVEEIHTHGCKFPRISTNLRQKGDEQYPNDDEDEKVKRLRGGGGGAKRFFGWPSSRIIRVSRASGGKDRHSKVWTTKGLKDRRVRLSVNTAIHLFDLQDRLGCDQPSKAIEWLLKSAASSIDDLPPINTSFCETLNQLSDEKRSSVGTKSGFDSTHLDLDANPNYQHHQNVSLSRSTCSSTSETSKGSGLSLSRSENPMKARERATEKTAEKEKEKENESQVSHHQKVNVNAIAQNSSFTELLTGNSSTTTTGSTHQNSVPGCGSEAINLLHKSSRQWNSTPMEYFASGLFGPSSSRVSSSIFLGNSFPQAMMVPQFNVVGDHHPELQHYSFVPEPYIPVVTASESGCRSNTSNSDYNLNFTIPSPTSSGLAGYNRGTLQSNSPSLLHHLQRLSPIDGSSNFFVSTTESNAADQKGKGKY